MGAKREYQAQFLIGARLLGSFKGAMSQAQSRMNSLAATAKRVGGLLKTALTGMLAGFGTFLAGSVLHKMFGDALQEAREAEQRTRQLTAALLLNKEVAKGGPQAAAKELAIIQKHNEVLEHQGVLHKDILDNMAIQLAMRGIPTKDINKSVDVMQNLLVATKGVTATEEDGVKLGIAWARAVKGNIMGLGKILNLSKEQKKIFGKLKTDQARQIWLMKNFGEAYKNVNAEARKTDFGKMQVFANAVKSLSNEIGDKLKPAIGELSQAWTDLIEDPQIRGMLLDVVGALGDAIKGVATSVRSDLIPALHDLASDPSLKAMADTAKGMINDLNDWLKKQKMIPTSPVEMLKGDAQDLQKGAEVWADIHKRIPGAPGREWARIREDITPAVGAPAATLTTGAMDPILHRQEEFAKLTKYTGIAEGVPIWNIMAQGVHHFGEEMLRVSPEPLSGIPLIQKDIKEAIEAAQPMIDAQTMSFDEEAQAVARLNTQLGEALRSLGEFAGKTISAIPVPPGASGVPGMQAGGIVTRPTLAMIGEGGPEAVVPLGAGVGGATSVNFAPVITINGNAGPGELRTLDSRLRDLARDFVNEFKRAQAHERRLSYEGGYT